MPEPDTSPHWHKSSFSGDGDCLEWATGPSGVRLRDSRNPAGPELFVTHSEWAAFIAGIKHGEADHHHLAEGGNSTGA